MLAPLGASCLNEVTDALYDRLMHEISESSSEKIIVSSENLTFAKPAFIMEMAERFVGFDVNVIFYIREQVQLVESVFLHWQKVGDNYQGAIESFFKTHKYSFDFMRNIAPWVECFGENAIISRLYEKTLIGDDVCRDIASVLGLVMLDDVKGGRENISLRPEFSSLVGLIDDNGICKERRDQIIVELLRLSEQFDAVAKASITSDQLRHEIAQFYFHSNLEFARKYLPVTHAEYLSRRISMGFPKLEHKYHVISAPR